MSTDTPKKSQAKTPKAFSETVATKEDIDMMLDAVKELTKSVTVMATSLSSMEKTHAKWVRAGKF